MITNYESDSVYEIFENQENGKKYKIGEIKDGTFYDLNINGKRITPGFDFRNDYSFWSQFQNITIKKISRPLKGYEPAVWGAYWTVSVLLTILLVSITDGVENQIFWIVASAIHLGITIKFRYNTIVVYWMAATTIIFLIILWSAGSKKKY